MSEQDAPPIKAEIERIVIQRKRMNEASGELEDIEPIIIEPERNGSD